METVNIGLIGLGYIGKVHTIAYRDIPLCFQPPGAMPRLRGLLRHRLDPDDPAPEAAGFETVTDDESAFFGLPLDVVDICTPNFLHLEQARKALESGAAVYCEKPLSDSLDDARAMAELAEAHEALTHVAFVLRYLPAIRLMKSLMERETVGEVLHFRAHMDHGSYLNPNRPMAWRLRHRESGGGAFIDLGIHLVDLIHYVLGPTATVRGWTRTFIEERPASAKGGRTEPVDVDDWALCRLTTQDGAVGTIEVTRVASGASSATALEVYGRRGALVFRADAPRIVRWHDLEQGRWTEVSGGLPAPDGDRPLSDIFPSGKYSQGYSTDIHLASCYDFLLDVIEGRESQADFRAGLAAQEVADALYRSAAENGALIELA